MGRRQGKASKHSKRKPKWLTALVAGSSGEIFELDGYAAVGMAGPSLVPLKTSEAIPLPFGGELMLLPGRRPVLYNIEKGEMEILQEDPYAPGEDVFPVAAFNSPGYVNSWLCAYHETDPDSYLPLFSYGAVGWDGDGFQSAVIQVDREPRQDLRRMKQEKVIAGVKRMQKTLPDNRLRAHLERCALEYGCPAGKNFFLGRYEAPLPASRSCNARCLGCISLQKNENISCSQERIDFTPSPEEIAGVALAHIRRVKRSIVSFGQGCEGDPLLAAHVIEPAIRLIRSETDEGTINLNTNASRPEILGQLFEAGLDSVRVSMNSVREPCYTAYFRPVDYSFPDVVASIDTALRRNKFVAINYLNCPGFTDSPEEIEALIHFRKHHPFHMIQWRNLNFDPLQYLRAMQGVAGEGKPLGMRAALRRIRSEFPDLIYGYFNPPKEKWRSAAEEKVTI